MSLIYGLKTQTGVYLAADTRLTSKSPSGLFVIEDDFGKFHSFGKFMHVVAAGDAGLASFLTQKIQISELSSSCFIEFREKIVDFVKGEIGLYPYIHRIPSVVFIFAGYDPGQREVVNMEKLVEYTKLMQGDTLSPVRQNISKPLADAMRRAAKKGGKAKILELDSPFTGLFSLEITFSNGVDIKLSDAETLTYLMYGPNKLTAKDAPPDLVVDIDMGGKPKDLKGQDILSNNCLELIGFFSEMIPKHQLHTVGGSVIVFWITENGIIFESGEVAMKRFDGSVVRNVSNIFVTDDKICTRIGGEIKPLRLLIDFYKTDEQLASAFI